MRSLILMTLALLSTTQAKTSSPPKVLKLRDTTNTTASTSTSCPSGNTYTVAAGDTATTISKTFAVSTRGILNINGLNAQGTDLQAGAPICLPLKCQIYTVPPGFDCNKLAQANGISLFALKQYNLDIDGGCTNLVEASNVCVTMPGSDASSGGGASTNSTASTTSSSTSGLDDCNPCDANATAADLGVTDQSGTPSSSSVTPFPTFFNDSGPAFEASLGGGGTRRGRRSERLI